MKSVGLVTCRIKPEPDPDEIPLRDAITRLGVSAVIAPWDQPDHPAWQSLLDPNAGGETTTGSVCVLRSTWNYIHHLEPFRSWLGNTANQAQLLNGLPTVQWNLDKRYLQALSARGVPIVPTAFVEPDGVGHTNPLSKTCAGRGWNGPVVIKPAVSAGSFGTLRFDTTISASMDDAEAHLQSLLKRGVAMVQPYVASVEAYGERSLVWIDGALTHSIRKQPRLAGADESVSDALPIADDERALADIALRALPAEVRSGLLYARVDLARDETGAPMLMELELVEPSLFLVQHPPALTRLAQAIAFRANGRASQ